LAVPVSFVVRALAGEIIWIIAFQFLDKLLDRRTRVAVRKAPTLKKAIEFDPKIALTEAAEAANLALRCAVSGVVVVLFCQHFGNHPVGDAFLPQFVTQRSVAAGLELAAIFNPEFREGPIIEITQLA